VTEQHLGEQDNPGPATAPTAPADPEQQRRRRERRFEVLSTLILACAALFTAWSSYQASLWDGLQSSEYSRAAALRIEAAEADSEANEYRLAHLDAFTTYLQARTTGNAELADYLTGRFPAPLDAAFAAWMAEDPFNNLQAPISPLAMPEYQLPQDAEAARLSAEATAAFESGEQANGISDTYTLATVLFATALFFAAISERFEFVAARITLLTIGGLSLAGGLAVLLSQPVTGG
jgi:hypothetical protein